MNTEETKRLIEGRKLLDAVIEGRKLEQLYVFIGDDKEEWVEHSPEWGAIFEKPQYWRIKPGPTYRPWKINEVPVGDVLIEKGSGIKRVLCHESNEHRGAYYVSGSGYCTCEVLRDMFTQLDGSPCGVLE